VSGVAQAKRHARGRKSRARAFDALADFDCVREHVLDMIDPGDQVSRSGWVFFDRSVSICWLVVTALPWMTRQAAERWMSLTSSQSRCRRGWRRSLPALREDNVVGRSHRVVRRILTLPLLGAPTVRW
jgi:hypothetical protein